MGADQLREVSEYSSGGALTGRVRYVWSGWALVGELDSSNKTVRSYTHGLDLSGTVGGAGGIGGLLATRDYSTSSKYVYLYRYDGKGNVTEVWRTNGTRVASYSYGPFGTNLVASGTYMQYFRFQTKLYHPRSGLYYFGYRFYSPQQARWLSRDPIGIAGGLNLYTFVGNNPVNFSDPLGLATYLLTLGPGEFPVPHNAVYVSTRGLEVVYSFGPGGLHTFRNLQEFFADRGRRQTVVMDELDPLAISDARVVAFYRSQLGASYGRPDECAEQARSAIEAAQQGERISGFSGRSGMPWGLRTDLIQMGVINEAQSVWGRANILINAGGQGQP